MTSLGRWLVGILNAHIERHNVVAAEPFTFDPRELVLTPDRPADDGLMCRECGRPENPFSSDDSWMCVRHRVSRPCPICGCHAAMADHECNWRAGVLPRPIVDGSTT